MIEKCIQVYNECPCHSISRMEGYLDPSTLGLHRHYVLRCFRMLRHVSYRVGL